MSKISFPVIALIQKNIVVLVPRYPQKNCILPRGVIYPQFGNHWFKCYAKCFPHNVEQKRKLVFSTDGLSQDWTFTGKGRIRRNTTISDFFQIWWILADDQSSTFLTRLMWFIQRNGFCNGVSSTTLFCNQQLFRNIRCELKRQPYATAHNS